jgi:hypothetical protein
VALSSAETYPKLKAVRLDGHQLHGNSMIGEAQEQDAPMNRSASP